MIERATIDWLFCLFCTVGSLYFVVLIMKEISFVLGHVEERHFAYRRMVHLRQRVERLELVLKCQTAEVFIKSSERSFSNDGDGPQGESGSIGCEGMLNPDWNPPQKDRGVNTP